MKSKILTAAIILAASTLFSQVSNSEQLLSATFNQEGWSRDGYDLGWSYFYPFDTDTLIQNNPFGVDWSMNVANPIVLTGDVNSDGLLEIVYTSNNSLYVLDGNGNELWSKNLGFIADYRSISLDDVTGDGTPEIGVNTKENSMLKLLFFDGSGSLIKEISETEGVSGDNHIHTRAVMDINNDGGLDVITGRHSGYDLWSRGVEVFDYESGNHEWFHSIGPGPLTLNIADITGDPDKEILIGTGGPANGHSVNGFSDNKCYAICYDNDGTLLWSRQFEGSGFVDSEVSVIDLDGDGNNEVIYTSRQHGWQWWNGDIGRIYLLNPDNGEIIKEYNAGNPLIVNGIADLVGNNNKEILVNYQDESSQTGKILMFDNSLNLLSEYVVPGSILRVCAINDLNGDGNYEIIVRKMMANEFVVLDENLDELWSLSYPDEVKDVIPSDLDNDGINELIVSTSQQLYVLSAKAATLKLTSPDGGEYWKWNTQQSIEWTSTSTVIENIKLWLSYDSGLTYNDLLFEDLPNDGEELWMVPEAQCTTARIKIEGYDAEGLLVAEDESNGDFFIYTTPPVSLDSGLVAFYPFNGNANDESENDNHGDVYGATLTTDRFGNVDKAYSFYGYNDGDYILVEDHESLKPQSVTISCFALFESPYSGHLVTKNIGDGNWESYTLFSWPSVNSVVSCIGTNDGHGSILQAPFEHDDLKWHHLVFSFDDPNDIEKIFIDGELSSQLIETQSIDYDDKPLYISGELDYSTPSFFFSGKIDDIRIYNRALKDFEVQALYHEGNWIINPSFMTELNSQVACKNDSVAFDVIVEGIPPINYQWQKDGVNISGATDSILIIPDVQMEDDGEYKCIATNDQGTGNSNTAILTVEFAIPTNIMGYTSVIEYQVATYSVDMLEGHTYEFMVEGGNKINGTENSITIHWGQAGQGLVNLLETSELGCTADDNILNVNIGSLGIDDFEIQNLSIYPNPSIGISDIRYQISDTRYVLMRVYDMYGREIRTILNEKQIAGDYTVQFDGSDLTAGLYLVRLQAGGYSETVKMIIMR